MCIFEKCEAIFSFAGLSKIEVQCPRIVEINYAETPPLNELN